MTDLIFRQIVTPSTLAAAWHRVRRNAGGPGIDRIDIAAFAPDAERRLTALSRSLASGLYRPRPLLKIEIPKRSGGARRLAVPVLLDRIAQCAAVMVLDERIDPRLSDASFGYRRGRSVGHALGRILTYRLWGCEWAFDADIADFFDTIPHDKLIAEVATRVPSPRTLELVRLWLLQSPRRHCGVPQGSPLSPLLSNIYLDPIDQSMDTRKSRLVRYADNILLLSIDRDAAARAGERMARLLAARGLTLNPAKTRLVRLDDSFVFLGYRVGGAVHVADGTGPEAAAVAPPLEPWPTAPLAFAHRCSSLQRGSKVQVTPRRSPE
jgi:CRISPR-associated protein Cas1